MKARRISFTPANEHNLFGFFCLYHLIMETSIFLEATERQKFRRVGFMRRCYPIINTNPENTPWRAPSLELPPCLLPDGSDWAAPLEAPRYGLEQKNPVRQSTGFFVVVGMVKVRTLIATSGLVRLLGPRGDLNTERALWISRH
jgi:hypothetical protein